MTMEITYPYKPRLTMLLGSLFFVGCAFILGMKAAINREGLVINGIIQLGVEGATVFLWCLAGLAALFVLITIYALWIGLRYPRAVLLNNQAISAPKSGVSTLSQHLEQA